MTAALGHHRDRHRRLVGWSVAATLLLAPLVAMQFTEEVAWGLADFVVFGALLLGAGLAFELAVRFSADAAYRTAVGLTLAAGFLLVWINGAVGIIGEPGNDANLMYGGVLGIAIIGALVSRFRPRGMAWTVAAAALALALVTAIAVLADLQPASSDSMTRFLVLNGFFVAVFLGAAGLFHYAARMPLSGEKRPRP